MGVEGSNKYIIDYTPKKVHAREFANHTCNGLPCILIDGRSLLCRYTIGSLNTKKFIVDANGDKIMELYYIFIIAVRFLKLGIMPIYVFDGKNPREKYEVAEKRKKTKDRADEILENIITNIKESILLGKSTELNDRASCDNANDNVNDNVKKMMASTPSIEGEKGESKYEVINDTDEEILRISSWDSVDNIVNDDKSHTKENLDKYIKYLKRSYRPNTSNIQLACILLKYMGLPVIEAPSEADSQCAAIMAYHPKNIMGVVTEDFDPLMFGSKNILKIISLGDSVMNEYTVDDTISNIEWKINRIIATTTDEKILNMYKDPVKISHENLIDIGCLMGTDYCSGIRPRKLTNDIPENKFRYIVELYLNNSMNYENVIESLQNIGYASSEYAEKLRSAKKSYYNAQIYDPVTLNLDMTEPNIEMVMNICKSFVSERETKALCKILVNMYNSSIRDFDRFRKDADLSFYKPKPYENFSSCRERIKREQQYGHNHNDINHNNHNHNHNHKHQSKYRYPNNTCWPEPLYSKPIDFTNHTGK